LPEDPETRYKFAYMWPRLQRNGWTYKKSRNPLVNWDYRPPPGWLEGDPVFESPSALIDAIKKLDCSVATRSEGPSTASSDESRGSLRVSQPIKIRGVKQRGRAASRPSRSLGRSQDRSGGGGGKGSLSRVASRRFCREVIYMTASTDEEEYDD
jgi:hypothetical protein